MPKLVIWSNAELTDDAATALEAGTAGHDLIVDTSSSNLYSGGPSPLLETADIAFGQPDPEQIMSLPHLRWIHLTSAGYTRYNRQDLKDALTARGATLTNSSSVFDEPCAQHLLGFMLAQARQLPQSLSDQLQLRAWNHRDRRDATRVLKNQTVLILGFGAIARRLVELLVPFNLTILGVRQIVRGDEPVPVHAVADLDRLLAQADHIVDILPANTSTNGLIDGRRFAAAKAGAVFYNVGRGTTVDQASLIEALTSGQLSAAYLDVTDPEPLPSDHPLWTTPNCFITPHIAGGHREEFPNLVEHFLANLHRFDGGFPLLDRVI
jgi:phosphoglycerate dehydrogenase-like enzyme